jgi:hypothetical protein
MIPADETFDGTWPFAPRFHEVPASGDSAASACMGSRPGATSTSG